MHSVSVVVVVVFGMEFYIIAGIKPPQFNLMYHSLSVEFDTNT